MTAPLSCFVNVRRYGDTHIATASGQRATCTIAPNFAALRVAAKVLRCGEASIRLSEIRQGERYLARKEAA